MINHKNIGGRHYRLSCAKKSKAFWRKSCGTYIVILLPEFLPIVQSEEVLQTCCVRMFVLQIRQIKCLYCKLGRQNVYLQIRQVECLYYRWLSQKRIAQALQDLIRQHRSRPSYARMISWEFSESGSYQITQPRRRRRSKRNKSGNSLAKEGDGKLRLQGEENVGEEDDAFIDKDGVENDSSSDDSEYHSAEEHLSDSDHLCRSGSISDSEISELASSFQTCRINVEDTEDEILGYENCVVHTGHKQRAPNKRQKRKRKKNFLNDLAFC